MEPILESFKKLWGKLSLPMRIGGGVLVLGVFLSLIFFSLFPNTDYQPLYTDLTPEDAASIITVLRDNGIPYQLSDNGSTVRIPDDQVYETRLTLASQGLPSGGIVGFEIFNTTRLGETEGDRELRYLVALQGELTRTIKELREVVDARVHIVLPRRSLFIQESQPSSASVLLTLKPGVTLSSKQVRGITHLLASSVEGLTSENITIIDNQGNVLSELIDLQNNFDSNLIAQRIQIESAYEKQLSSTLTSMLERIYGIGKVVTLVNVELDFDKSEEYSETFDAPSRDGGLIRSEETLTEEFVGSTYSAQGIPGVESNVPGYVGLDEDDSNAQSEYSRRDSTINYELNRTERRYSNTPGSIKRLGVSVWINGDLTAEQLRSIESSVTGAIGIRLERGDQISVNSIPFEDDFMTLAPTDSHYAPTQNLLWIYIISAITLLLAVLVGIFLYRRRKAQQELPVAIAEDEEDEDILEREPLTPEEKLRQNITQRLKEQAKERPEEFAQMLRGWLLED